MKSTTLLICATLLCLPLAHAEEPGVIEKTGNAVEHGAKKTVETVERGAHAAGRGIKKGAKVVAEGVEHGAHAVGNAAGKVARKVGIDDTAPAGDANADQK